MHSEADTDLQTASTVLREKRGRLPFRDGYLPRFRYVSVPGVCGKSGFLHLTEETLDGVLHEAADGHRTDSSGNRSYH